MVCKFSIANPPDSHRRCFACGSENADGLGLVFDLSDDDHVCGECIIGERYQGYPGVVQGGIVATILDCAMTNCLFASGVEAMTARLNVEFHMPVVLNETLRVEACVVNRCGKVFDLEASIFQCESEKASATARFMVRSNAL